MSRERGTGGEGAGDARSGSRSEPGREEPAISPPRGRAGAKRKFTRAEKDAILAELEQSGESVPDFAAKRGLSGPTIYTWRSDARTGSSGAERQRRSRRTRPPEKK